MVTKDDPFKAPASGLRKAAAGAAGATSKPAAAPAAAAPRAAASPSRARAGAAAAATKPAAKPAVPAAKPAATAAPKPPAVKAPAAAVKAPAAKVASPSTSSPKAAAPKAAVGTTKAGSSAAPKAATKAGAGAKAGAVKGTGKAGSKGTAAALEAGAAAAAAAAAPAAVEAPGPDPQEEAARRAEMEAKAAEEMEALRKAAWQAQVDYERRQEAKRRQAREEEAKRKKEEAALRKQLLEAAYDGEVDVLRKGLSRAREAGLLRPDPVDAADGHGNTLLSEAAAGGQAEAAAMLLQAGEGRGGGAGGAGRGRRGEVIPILLHGGADPRIGNEGGELPEHVAPAPLRPLLAEWDTARTDALVAAHEARRAEAAASAQAERAQAVRGAEAGLAAAEEAHVRAQQALRHSRMELEKRITEYDICVEERKPEGLTAVALDQVKQQEQVVATAKGRAAEAAEALDAARLALREHQQQQAAAGEGEGGEALPGLPVAVKALNDVLIRDVGGKLAEAGRWPLVIDSSGQASVFLRYQDINYVNALNSRHMEPGMLRRALLGGLRYGKPLVLDLQDCDLWSEMPRMFDQVHKGLLASLLDRSLLAGEAWAVLIRPEDGDEYDVHRFQDARLRAFRFIVLTASPRPPPELLAATQALRVVLSET
ncbi:hypothetical protein HYH03_009261 [Edaphochlamys debaryana]|uniref:Uncharacterized protein n=1 Tax=Edaphochlamys debaryana TaxID=47281 RepID=A0A835XZ73_9CHLO|nr:hypothetical protein HYH03_009261 [Edaphochlamys debaryana]|eukprot:KAG2492307.1 hypothetical protein HYH03_009261 [Edaphochlamys debaryana]